MKLPVAALGVLLLCAPVAQAGEWQARLEAARTAQQRGDAAALASILRDSSRHLPEGQEHLISHHDPSAGMTALQTLAPILDARPGAPQRARDVVREVLANPVYADDKQDAAERWLRSTAARLWGMLTNYAPLGTAGAVFSISIAALLLAWLMGLGLRLLWQRRPYERPMGRRQASANASVPSAAQRLAEADAAARQGHLREALTLYFTVLLMRAAAQAGLSFSATSTNREVTRQLQLSGQRDLADTVSRISEAVEPCLYGGHPVQPSHLEEVRRAVGPLL